MAYRWPDKDPDETADFSVDWSRFIPDTSLSAASWTIKDASGTKVSVNNGDVVDGLQFITSTISAATKVVTARFALGTVNKTYSTSCSITTGNGLTFERSIQLRIKEK
tara:strand:- start:693 stop:1016 length:324 start_codon:yes stop_codon:yes gene_type:complete